MTEEKKKKLKKKIASKRTEDHGSADSLIVRSQSSVEVTKDAKDGMKWVIKVYCDDPAIAAAEAHKTDMWLKEKYGMLDEEE